MQSSIVQTLALAMAVNARITRAGVSRFWPDASAFTFCSSVRFVDPGTRGFFGRRSRVLAANPQQWLDAMLPGTRGARVHVASRGDPNLSDHLSSAFVGGGSRWLLELVGKRDSELWEADWALGPQDAEGRTTWSVSYLRVDPHWRGGTAAADLTVLKQVLAEVLEGIAGFAIEQDLGFVESFAGARALLDSTDPMAGQWFADMVPEGLDLAARQLLAAGSAAWVFGGMGSWNDYWLEGEAGERYAEWSSRLFDAIQAAVAAAVNSSFPENR